MEWREKMKVTTSELLKLETRRSALFEVLLILEKTGDVCEAKEKIEALVADTK